MDVNDIPKNLQIKTKKKTKPIESQYTHSYTYTDKKMEKNIFDDV